METQYSTVYSNRQQNFTVCRNTSCASQRVPNQPPTPIGIGPLVGVAIADCGSQEKAPTRRAATRQRRAELFMGPQITPGEATQGSWDSALGRGRMHFSYALLGQSGRRTRQRTDCFTKRRPLAMGFKVSSPAELWSHLNRTIWGQDAPTNMALLLLIKIMINIPIVSK